MLDKPCAAGRKAFEYQKTLVLQGKTFFFHKISQKQYSKVGPGDSISYRLMRLKKDFLQIHFSNYACSVAREHPSYMPTKTPENLGRTNERTNGLFNYLDQTSRALRAKIVLLIERKHCNSNGQVSVQNLVKTPPICPFSAP